MSMRITLVISALTAGGAERIMTSLANHWVEQGRGVTLITFDDAPPYYPLDDRVDLRQLDLVTFSRPLPKALISAGRRVIALRRAIKQSKPDIVISFLGKINALTVLATRGMSMPVVVSERNNPDRQVFRPAWHWTRRRLYGLAERVVTPSQGVLDWFPEKIRARGKVIPNPVDLPKEIEPRVPGSPGLIAVGRLDDQKGFDLLLRAYSQIADQFPDWTLTIRGDGKLRGDIERLRDQLGLHDKVHMPGITERPGAWVDEGEIFVLSSRYESFGNVLTEAMVAGLPIVSFDCPFGPGEIIADGVDGILVPPEDPQALAEAMAEVMRNAELRQRLGEAAQKNVRRFARSRIMRLWDELVADLVGVSERT
ncbi:MAG: glycosyltransferase family 4 protein [Alphaproteobacteria bacterium]|nr:glycosyltransferase family 4 protein [Alphaproteobacteria bacterium]